MAYKLYNIDTIFDSMSAIKEQFYDGLVRFNETQIMLCYPGSSFEPREIMDSVYWMQTCEYLYRMYAQIDFDYPLITHGEYLPSHVLLDVELGKIRYDFLEPTKYLIEYAAIHKIATCAVTMYHKFHEQVGAETFQYFIHEPGSKKLRFVLDSLNEFEYDYGNAEDSEIMELIIQCHVSSLGTNCAITAENLEFYKRLPIPITTGDPEDDEEINKNLAFRERALVVVNSCMKESYSKQ